jgi:hypothetical protein
LTPLTLKINRVPDSPKDYVCRVFTRMLCSKKLTVTLTYDLENQ